MWEVLGGLFVATAVSGVVPLVNAELLVVTAAAALPAVAIPFVALAATAGQMSAKLSLFALARWAPSRLPDKARRALERATRSLEARGGAVWSLVFVSATTGVPPFYGTSLAAGSLGVRTSSFVTSGCCGRIVRFGVLAWLGRRLGSAAIETFAAVAGATPVAGG